MKVQSTLLQFAGDQLSDLSNSQKEQMVKQSIINLIVTNARQEINKTNGVYRQFVNLLEPLNQWKNKHYQNLACMLDIPTNTLKYYMHEGTSLKNNNRKKVLQFLGYTQQEWGKLEAIALDNLISQN